MNDPAAAPNEVETPIINSPFAEPHYHWQIEQGKPPVPAEGRRPASYFYRVPDSATRGRKPKAQLSLKGDRGLDADLDLGQQEGYGVPASYLPDFIAVLLSGLILLIEIKGQYGDDADLKAKAAQRWVEAVNRAGGFGTWAYRVVTDPPALGKLLDALSGVQ